MSSAPAAVERASVRLAEISVNQAAFDEKIVGVFRFDADARGKRGPTLILLAEIASSLYVYEQLLDALCAAAERTRQLMSGVDTDPMTRFEKMTQQLNEAVASFELYPLRVRFPNRSTLASCALAALGRFGCGCTSGPGVYPSLLPNAGACLLGGTVDQQKITP